MTKVFIINAHQPYPFSEGKLNASLIEKAQAHFDKLGYETRLTTMSDDWDIDTEIANHQWADIVLLQSPVNWMGVPWADEKIHGPSLHLRHGWPLVRWRWPYTK